MGAPDRPQDFFRATDENLTIYVACDIRAGLDPGRSRLLFSVPGYGRFWLRLCRSS
jgi:hypothetical protein